MAIPIPPFLAAAALKQLPWPKILRIGGAALLVLAVAFMLWRAAATYRDAIAVARTAGVEEGELRVTARWNAANAKVADDRLQSFMNNVGRSMTAQQNYLADLAARQPAINEVIKNVETFMRAPAGAQPCLAIDPVGLWSQSRRANGLQPAGADPAAAR